jgi:hypothetical protein
MKLILKSAVLLLLLRSTVPLLAQEGLESLRHVNAPVLFALTRAYKFARG